MSSKTFEYQVALSFAGENRDFVSEVAKCLKENNISAFYDEFEEVKLWGKDLYTYLHEVYSEKAEYCVMFLSKYYAEKLWTSHERESAQERAFREKQEYILPLRFDNTKIPGIKETVGYVSIGSRTPKQICELIILKVKGSDKEPINSEEDVEQISIPKIKRTITDLEKNEFLKNTYEIIKEYFDNGLKKLEVQNTHCKTNLKDISDHKFISEIYVEGKLKVKCKIWIGDSSFNNRSINYLESSSSFNVDNDNTLNDSATLEDNGIEMYYHILMGGMYTEVGIDKEKVSPKDVSKYFWLKFINYLKY